MQKDSRDETGSWNLCMTPLQLYAKFYTKKSTCSLGNQ